MKKPDKTVVKMLEIRDELARRGLYRTMHAMGEALQVVGWELAGHREKSPYEITRTVGQ